MRMKNWTIMHQMDRRSTSRNSLSEKKRYPWCSHVDSCIIGRLQIVLGSSSNLQLRTKMSMDHDRRIDCRVSGSCKVNLATVMLAFIWQCRTRKLLCSFLLFPSGRITSPRTNRNQNSLTVFPERFHRSRFNSRFPVLCPVISPFSYDPKAQTKPCSSL
jgi:hypothetical protein